MKREQNGPSEPATDEALSLGAHRGWHSRGYLPHFDSPEQTQSITFRLHDAVPEKLVLAWREELGWIEDLPSQDEREVELRRRVDRYEDAGHGECLLRDNRIASLVQGALVHFDAARYRLAAWSIMPNHVHVVIQAAAGYPLEKVVHSWKSFTALKANRMLGRSGTFWFRDYRDRFIRDEKHYGQAVAYVESNPVQAGLVQTPADWKCGSAHWRADHANGSCRQDAGGPGKRT